MIGPSDVRFGSIVLINASSPKSEQYRFKKGFVRAISFSKRRHLDSILAQTLPVAD